jgi:hypothetical protein
MALNSNPSTTKNKKENCNLNYKISKESQSGIDQKSKTKQKKTPET